MADTGVEETRIPVRDIPVEEPPLPQRTRRNQDIFRLVLTTIGVFALVGLAIVADRTLSGLRVDLRQLGERLPTGPVEILSVAAQLVGLLLRPFLVVLLMIRGRLRTPG